MNHSRAGHKDTPKVAPTLPRQDRAGWLRSVYGLSKGSESQGACGNLLILGRHASISRPISQPRFPPDAMVQNGCESTPRARFENGLSRHPAENSSPVISPVRIPS
jgi:hypothetical protein